MLQNEVENEDKLLAPQRLFKLHWGPLGSQLQQNHFGPEGEQHGTFMVNGLHFSFRNGFGFFFYNGCSVGLGMETSNGMIHF